MIIHASNLIQDDAIPFSLSLGVSTRSHKTPTHTSVPENHTRTRTPSSVIVSFQLPSSSSSSVMQVFLVNPAVSLVSGCLIFGCLPAGDTCGHRLHDGGISHHYHRRNQIVQQQWRRPDASTRIVSRCEELSARTSTGGGRRRLRRLPQVRWNRQKGTPACALRPRR